MGALTHAEPVGDTHTADDAYARIRLVLRVAIPASANAPNPTFLHQEHVLQLLMLMNVRPDGGSLMAQVATTAGSVLREAIATKEIRWATLHLALKSLQLLPPRISVAEHEVVARLLADEEPCIMSFAAHTLACMGPQAVAEHYEEILAIADAPSAPIEDFHASRALFSDRNAWAASAAYRLGASRDCASAAWLCVTLLEPVHLLRLEARGAPVSSLGGPRSPFAAAEAPLTDGLFSTNSYGAGSHIFPDLEDVLRAYEHARTSFDAPTCLYGPVVQERALLLDGFAPVQMMQWSPETHAAFPAAARARAVELLWIGAGIANASLAVPLDLWVSCVIPHVVERRSLPGGGNEAQMPLGLKWVRLARPPSDGVELPSESAGAGLIAALQGQRTSFSREQFEAFRVRGLKLSSYLKVRLSDAGQEVIFAPDPTKRCPLRCALPEAET